MNATATGTFEVKLTPTEDSPIGRMLLDKTFRGDLEGVSKGQMLAVQGAEKRSAGYVAMEIVTATLQGRTGTFALQHSGKMTRGAPTLSVTVVPDSGTDQLMGLTGSMKIIIAEGRHSYEFEYTFTE